MVPVSLTIKHAACAARARFRLLVVGAQVRLKVEAACAV